MKEAHADPWISLQFADGVYLVLLMGLLEGYFVPLHSFFLTPDSFEQKVRGGAVHIQLTYAVPVQGEMKAASWLLLVGDRASVVPEPLADSWHPEHCSLPIVCPCSPSHVLLQIYSQPCLCQS